jgi:hypothetical protein
MLLGASSLGAQERVAGGPTVSSARAAFSPPMLAKASPAFTIDTKPSCGSSLKNAAMLGLGFSVAAVMLELTYTVIREPLIRRGHDLPPADPMLIAWAGGAGFVLGLMGTELCRNRR